MALVSTRQFHPATSIIDSFQCSVFKLHGCTRLRFFRYGSSFPFKRHILYAGNKTANSASTPQSDSKFIPGKKKNKWGFTFKTPTSHCGCWLDGWNETQKPKPPQAVLSYRNSGNVSSSDCEESNYSSGAGSTMERIVEKLKTFGYIDDVNEKKEQGAERVIEKGSVEDIFYIEDGMLPTARGGFSKKSPLGDETMFGSGREVRFPWEKPAVKEDENKYSVRQKSRTSSAELTLPHLELTRLRNLALRMKSKIKIGGAGVTHQVVKLIHEKWKSSEVVRLKIEGAPALNMKRMHEILERKTGGLVIWRSGTSVSLYRGVSYDVHSERLSKSFNNTNEISVKSSSTATEEIIRVPLGIPTDTVHQPQTDSSNAVEENKSTAALPEVKYEDEVDKLLDGLGPRYTDWPGCDPLPVDADLLPGIVPGYQPPFRILPYGVRSTLGLKEATALRRLARVLPPHFALGRSRQHQGLAEAMIKLWERSSIAKIALKRGVQLTTSERMAEDIKRLTGGMLLSRNKDFLVFYRGKNFLSTDVAEALLEKERLAKTLQDEEEQARLRASTMIKSTTELIDESGIAGTLTETLDADARWGKKLDDHYKEKVMKEAELERHANLVRKLEKNLAYAERKLMRAERALAKVEAFLDPSEGSTDPQSITDEERFMFRKLGLRMKAFLLLGRRGVFDGTVENMHLHWKYRELVKIILKAKNFEQVKSIALSLEAESGGVLVSVDKVSKGYAIIVFRGKDYKRPSALRPKNLLTKRKALARSIELQRREAILNHISTVQTRVDKLRSELDQMAKVKEQGDEKLYDKLDDTYPTEDENSEDDDDGAFLETENGVDTIHSESDNSIYHNLDSAFPDKGLESDLELESCYSLGVTNASHIRNADDDVDEEDEEEDDVGEGEEEEVKQRNSKWSHFYLKN